MVRISRIVRSLGSFYGQLPHWRLYAQGTCTIVAILLIIHKPFLTIKDWNKGNARSVKDQLALVGKINSDLAPDV